MLCGAWKKSAIHSAVISPTSGVFLSASTSAAFKASKVWKVLANMRAVVSPTPRIPKP